MNAETGFFLTPGKFPERITLFPNKRIVFEDHQGNLTCEHGHWEKWTNIDGTLILQLTFHCRGSEEDEDLKSHVLTVMLGSFGQLLAAPGIAWHLWEFWVATGSF